MASSPTQHPASDTIVLKFGSSVIPSQAQLAHVVHEIYRYHRAGRRVVAVVSAIGSTTDTLLTTAREFGDRPSPTAVATLAATGEARAVALLTLALDRAGVHVNALDPGALNLRTQGVATDASPTSINREALICALNDAPVLVVPGFIGRDELGRATLLGRGGSDFTAVYIAAALGCECVLIKDVDALYDRDPARDPSNAQRLNRASYDDVLALSEGIVQHKAVRFVKDRGVRILISRVGHEAGTVIDSGPTTRGDIGISRGHPPLRVLLLGLGTVGLGVYQHLKALPDLFEIVGVIVRDTAKASLHVAGHIPISTDPRLAAETSACDIMVETIGGRTPATQALHAALSRGIHVVTANKAAVAASLNSLRDAAQPRGAHLLFSAAVGGGVPVLERVRDIASNYHITDVRGVINGTTNFVLDRLHAAIPFEAAVSEAQRAGFAEADPSSDLDGLDAANKLALIADAAFGTLLPVESIARSTIRGISAEDAARATREGRKYRVVARLIRSESGHVVGSVTPETVSASDPLALATNEENCVVVTTREGPNFTIRGRGAGRYPTAESVVGDCLALRRTILSSTSLSSPALSSPTLSSLTRQV